MKLLWTADWWGGDYSNGYTVHSRMMKQALLDAGVELVFNAGQPYDLAVHFAPVVPEYYHPVAGARNLLFTMVELTEPTMWHSVRSPELLAQTTALVVPTRHSRDVLSRYYGGSIHICSEGCSERFAFHGRRQPGPDERFGFLWLGATWDRRKGHSALLEAWRCWARTGLLPGNAELYIKTTKPPDEDLIFPEFGDWNGSPEVLEVSTPAYPRVIVDARRLPLGELIKLYNSAAVFVAPSQGEGWNLPLSDAAATGCPCIYTAFSGHLDYMDETVGIPITDFSMLPLWGKDDSGAWRKHGEGPPSYFGAHVEPPALILAMLATYHNYPEVLERGWLASERMHGQYTWAAAARRFVEICEQYR